MTERNSRNTERKKCQWTRHHSCYKVTFDRALQSRCSNSCLVDAVLCFVIGRCAGSLHSELFVVVSLTVSYSSRGCLQRLEGRQRAGEYGRNVSEGWETANNNSKIDFPMGCSAKTYTRGLRAWKVETEDLNSRQDNISFRSSDYLHSSCSCEWAWITHCPKHPSIFSGWQAQPVPGRELNFHLFSDLLSPLSWERLYAGKSLCQPLQRKWIIFPSIQQPNFPKHNCTSTRVQFLSVFFRSYFSEIGE